MIAVAFELINDNLKTEAVKTILRVSQYPEVSGLQNKVIFV